MSLRTLAMLIINLGGEMIYILDQCLRSQNVTGAWSEDDRKRVLNDVVGAMFSKPLMEDLMKPGGLYSHRALRCVLARLAHCSILRLSQDSRDRVLLCPRPRDLLLVSFNHFDGVRELVKANPRMVNLISEAQRQFTETYIHLSDGEFQLVRQSLLTLFHDMHVKVSFFLQEKIQNHDGHFTLATSGPVPWGTEVPGLIRWFNSRGREVMRRTFESGGSYTSSVREGSFGITGDRVIRLGTNMKHLVLVQGSEGRSWAEASPAVRVSLFPSDPEEEEEEGGISTLEDEPSFGTINIQATKANDELSRIAAEFTEPREPSDSPDKGGDLLAMMDDL